jgi:hypothetical protein
MALDITPPPLAYGIEIELADQAFHECVINFFPPVLIIGQSPGQPSSDHHADSREQVEQRHRFERSEIQRQTDLRLRAIL